MKYIIPAKRISYDGFLNSKQIRCIDAGEFDIALVHPYDCAFHAEQTDYILLVPLNL